MAQTELNEVNPDLWHRTKPIYKFVVGKTQTAITSRREMITADSPGGLEHIVIQFIVVRGVTMPRPAFVLALSRNSMCFI